jgi:hypothetical protein
MEPTRFAGRITFVRTVITGALFAVALVVVSAQDKGTSAPASAGNQTFRVGGKTILLPSPSTDVVEVGSDYRVLMENFVPENNRLLAGFIPPENFPALKKGSLKSLETYAMVEVPRRAEFMDMDAGAYKQIVDALSKQFGADLEAQMKEQEETINRRLKSLSAEAATISLDKPVPLGLLFSKTDACGVGLIMPVSSQGSTTRMVMGMTVLRVQSRILFGYVYTVYKDETTVQWVRKTTEAWADTILKRNKA